MAGEGTSAACMRAAVSGRLKLSRGLAEAAPCGAAARPAREVAASVEPSAPASTCAALACTIAMRACRSASAACARRVSASVAPRALLAASLAAHASSSAVAGAAHERFAFFCLASFISSSFSISCFNVLSTSSMLKFLWLHAS